MKNERCKNQKLVFAAEIIFGVHPEVPDAFCRGNRGAMLTSGSATLYRGRQQRVLKAEMG